MGASRQTQRAQEHAQQRIARDDPHPSVPELREAWREVAKDATPDARHALSQLVDSHDRWVVRAERAERERDRMREERDAIARTAAKAGDVLEEVIRDRDRHRAAVDAVWSILNNGRLLPQNRSEAARNCLASRGFGGDQ